MISWYDFLQTIAALPSVPIPWPAVAALIMTLIINTAALFYWGGGVRQVLKEHERRIGKLEDIPRGA